MAPGSMSRQSRKSATTSSPPGICPPRTDCSCDSGRVGYGTWASVAKSSEGERPRPSLEGQGEGLLEDAFDLGKELGAVGSVEDPVVAAEGHLHQLAGDYLAVFDDGAIGDRSDGEDARLRRVDDRAEGL